MELDLFIEDEEQQETDDDIRPLDQNSFSSAVVSGNDWTTETLISQIDKGNILLNPDFQRRDAWDKKRKSKFIESLILGLPIPQVVLAESKERRGRYIVLDGKQRLLSIRQFSAENDDKDYKQLKLTNLEIRTDLKGKNLADLRNDPEYYDDLAAFENQAIRTIVIKNWPDEDFLFHVFLRLNTGSVPLSPQELRQALHPGDFVQYLDKSSSNSKALKEILKIKAPDFRMRDTELLLRFIAFKNFLHLYTGTLKKFLDDVCLNLNKTWDVRSGDIEHQIQTFESTHIFLDTIFNGNQYKKWGGTSYEKRFNRAIFDILTLSFYDKAIRDLSVGKELEIENTFKDLCVNNQDFRSSIESTTKSLGATHNRISIWISALNDVLGSNVHVPVLKDNRII
ncbi:MAG: DUF262 domain-containing protein [Colwellia sp.]